MRFYFLMIAIVVVSSCATASPESNYAKTYASAYAKGFEDGFNKAADIKMPEKQAAAPITPQYDQYGYPYYDTYGGYGGAPQKGTLSHAVQTGDMKSVKEIIDGKKAGVNDLDQSGYSPLQIASRMGFIDVMEYLISKGATINFASSDGYTPLKEAITYKKFSAADILIAKGADTNYIDSAGYSMLYYACASGNKKLVE
ncbi:MAG TPA: ankyrin repeat domain-containing protein, partial [bacterium]|nr:ankyrin repeat domain-containing protein [bacterium]